jgi:hypothetical protein
MALPKFQRFEKKSRDSARIARHHHLVKMIKTHYAETGKFPGNAKPGTPCSVVPGHSVFFDDDCMSEIRPFLGDSFVNTTYDHTEKHYYYQKSDVVLYYNYGSLIVVNTLVELPAERNDTCSARISHWCHRDREYCTCIEKGKI